MTWARITDGPVWPGVGEFRYQPARSCAVIGGTSTVPSAANPSCMTGVSTPIAGICSRTGTERSSACTVFAAFAVFAAGRADGDALRGRTVAALPAWWPPQPASSAAAAAVAAVANARLDSEVTPRPPASAARRAPRRRRSPGPARHSRRSGRRRCRSATPPAPHRCRRRPSARRRPGPASPAGRLRASAPEPRSMCAVPWSSWEWGTPRRPVRARRSPARRCTRVPRRSGWFGAWNRPLSSVRPRSHASGCVTDRLEDGAAAEQIAKTWQSHRSPDRTRARPHHDIPPVRYPNEPGRPPAARRAAPISHGHPTSLLSPSRCPPVWTAPRFSLYIHPMSLGRDSRPEPTEGVPHAPNRGASQPTVGLERPRTLCHLGPPTYSRNRTMQPSSIAPGSSQGPGVQPGPTADPRATA
ncbi:hypothetical protein SBRY_30678 [Actinacidiphila bryophytorum]|uniref:Uncharacterized protein n=1 Tax=Actinacidiphila bryophytorum TaxID=1436133 RepID=A0A9W4MBS2_9ACTN|nr:hypothetical protein SBRY_30678 [Actinacidiphila bryophytorum]